MQRIRPRRVEVDGKYGGALRLGKECEGMRGRGQMAPSPEPLLRALDALQHENVRLTGVEAELQRDVHDSRPH
jgi:hypothetical protein